MGFLIGHEVEWLPEALGILRDDLPNIEVTISSQTSPELAAALLRGKVDVAFLRPENGAHDLAFKLLTKEPLVVVLPSDHRFAALKAISPQEIVGETFVGVSKTAPVLRAIVDDYLKSSGIHITPDNEADNLSSAISLVSSTRGIALLPVLR